MTSHTHTRLTMPSPTHRNQLFTCVICGQLANPKDGWTTVKYNIIDRGLLGVYQCPKAVPSQRKK